MLFEVVELVVEVWLFCWLEIGVELLELLLLLADEELVVPLLVTGVELEVAVEEVDVVEDGVVCPVTWLLFVGVALLVTLVGWELGVVVVVEGVEGLLDELVLGAGVELLVTGLVLTDCLLLVATGLVVGFDCCELEVWELFASFEVGVVVELVELAWEVVELLVDVLLGFTLVGVVEVVVAFDVDVFAVVVESFAFFAALVFFTSLLVVEVVLVWLAGWLAVELDDPQETTHAGMIHATAAIPNAPPKIFQIFFFMQ